MPTTYVVPYSIKGLLQQLPGTCANARVTAAQARSVKLRTKQHTPYTTTTPQGLGATHRTLGRPRSAHSEAATKPGPGSHSDHPKRRFPSGSYRGPHANGNKARQPTAVPHGTGNAEALRCQSGQSGHPSCSLSAL